MMRYPLSTGTLVHFIKLNRKIVEVKQTHVYQSINIGRMANGGLTEEKETGSVSTNLIFVLIDVLEN